MTRRAGAVLLATEGAGRLGEGLLAFVKVHGRTMLSLSVSVVEASPAVHGFVVVAPPGKEREAAALAGSSPKFVAAVPAGATREESVRRALEALPSSFDVVVCHDVDRPLARPELFDAVIGALDGADAAVPQVPVADTLKRVEDEMVQDTLSREGIGQVQTPQAFRREVLTAATRAGGAGGRSELSLLEAGSRVATVPGERANIKVCSPEDLRLAEALLAEWLGGDDGR
jgi:2-C-methyl-D-erythritol 4-phosphate cytidylyltransferase